MSDAGSERLNGVSELLTCDLALFIDVIGRDFAHLHALSAFFLGHVYVEDHAEPVGAMHKRTFNLTGMQLMRAVPPFILGFDRFDVDRCQDKSQMFRGGIFQRIQ